MASDLLPPGPRSPAVAQTLRYLSDPLGLMRACAAQFGDVFTIQLAGIGDLVLVSSPAHVKTLLAAPLEVLEEATHKVFAPMRHSHAQAPDVSGHARNAATRRSTERVVARWRPGSTFPWLTEAEQISDDEITSIALAWVLECVLGRPDVLSRVLVELRERELEQLSYVDAVIRESLRVRPIVATGGTRVVRAPFALGGHVLPAGTYVAACVPELYRRPELYTEPDTFRPERFLDLETETDELGPFVALQELKVALVTLLSCARLELACRDVRARARGLFLAPEAGLPVTYLGPTLT
jgi:cytochrome P450